MYYLYNIYDTNFHRKNITESKCTINATECYVHYYLISTQNYNIQSALLMCGIWVHGLYCVILCKDLSICRFLVSAWAPGTSPHRSWGMTVSMLCWQNSLGKIIKNSVDTSSSVLRLVCRPCFLGHIKYENISQYIIYLFIYINRKVISKTKSLLSVK